MWVGQRPGQQNTTPPAGRDEVRLSDAGKAAAEAEASGDITSDEATDNDPRLSLIRSLIEMLTGRSIEIFDATDLQAPPADVPTPGTSTVQPAGEGGPVGWGMAYDRHESYTEIEQTSFSASGQVRTADGREITFDLQLSMARAYHEESDIRLRLGDAARKTDPLVLNFSGTAAQLTDQRFAFDLNADGRTEQINFVAPGSGFLVFDRNRDGKVNDGRELFGPSTNDGFQELAALDDDRNSWIDEKDGREVPKMPSRFRSLSMRIMVRSVSFFLMPFRPMPGLAALPGLNAPVPTLYGWSLVKATSALITASSVSL